MFKQRLYQSTILVLLLIFGFVGVYSFEKNPSRAQTRPTPMLDLTLAGDPADPRSFFSDYATWPSSSTPKQNDYMKHVLAYMDFGNPSSGAYYTSNFLDINGDGLVDSLNSWNDGQYMVVFLNNGANNFTVGYKCYVADNKWYGDCAA